MARTELETYLAGKYRDMCKRFAPKKNAAGLIIRLGREIPFDFYTFDKWVVSQSDQAKGVAWQCVYCRRWMAMNEIRVDHRIPTARGGGLSLDNLCCCCDRCNRQKGELIDYEYVRIVEFARTMLVPAAADYLMKCLAGGGQAQRLRFTRKKGG